MKKPEEKIVNRRWKLAVATALWAVFLTAICYLPSTAFALSGVLKQSTAVNVTVVMIDSTDHVTGKTNLSLTIRESKAAGGFATITPTVTELEGGVYKLAFTTAHTDTLGELRLRVTAAGADESDPIWQVVALLPGDGVTVATNNDKTGYTVSTVSDKTGYSLTQTFPTNFSALAITAGGLVDINDKTGFSLVSTDPIELTIEAGPNSTKRFKASALTQAPH